MDLRFIIILIRKLRAIYSRILLWVLFGVNPSLLEIITFDLVFISPLNVVQMWWKQRMLKNKRNALLWADIFICVFVWRTRSMRRNALISKFTTQSKTKKNSQMNGNWYIFAMKASYFCLLCLIKRVARIILKRMSSQWGRIKILPSSLFLTNHPHNLNWQHIRRSITFYEYLTNFPKQIDSLADNISSGLICLCLLNS